MGLIIECPKCGHWNSGNSLVCKGNFRSGNKKGQPCTVRNFRRVQDKVYLVEYRDDDGKKIRERIGNNRIDAEMRFQEVKLRKENKSVEVESNITIKKLFEWYEQLLEIRSKRAYKRIVTRINTLRRLIDVQLKVSDLTISHLETFVATRAAENSPMRVGEKIAPKTIHEELNLLKTIIKKAVDHGRLATEPMKPKLYPKIEVDNTREKIFTDQELRRLLQECPLWLRRIVIMAQATGMRQNEIVALTWDRVDLERGYVRLKATATKTRESRIVKLLPHVVDMLIEIPRVSHSRRVFLSPRGNPLPYWTTFCHDSWKKALSKAGITDACFHDLRHDFITKAVRGGTRPYVVMKQVGLKSDAMLRRYHLIDENDLDQLKM